VTCSPSVRCTAFSSCVRTPSQSFRASLPLSTCDLCECSTPVHHARRLSEASMWARLPKWAANLNELEIEEGAEEYSTLPRVYGTRRRAPCDPEGALRPQTHAFFVASDGFEPITAPAPSRAGLSVERAVAWSGYQGAPAPTSCTAALPHSCMATVAARQPAGRCGRVAGERR